MPVGRIPLSPPIALTGEVSSLLAQHCVVAVGVSGGKDSDACALAVNDHLNAIGHTGPRILIHADLGVVEWQDSLPSCQRLAAYLGWELIVVTRKAGDMLDRWYGRWANNVARYADLSCVKLILPWSTPSMRFCTSELKVDVICAALKKRFPGQHILNVAGIRRQESASRQKMPISAPQKKLERPRDGLSGVTWNAIIEWKIEEVFARIATAGLDLHEAYIRWKASRVSCVFCIMSALEDLLAGASSPDNHGVYASMVELEAESTFAFQGNRWLGDVAPHLLPADLLERIAVAKRAAALRQEIEGTIPAHLLYTAGWPTVMPTSAEAELIADVRRKVSGLLGIEAACLTAADVTVRYAELMAMKDAAGNKDGTRVKKAAKPPMKKAA